MNFIFSFILRDLKTELSYRFNFAIHLFGILFQILLFYFIAKLIGPDAGRYLSEYGNDYFSFVLVGIAFANFLSWALNNLSENIRQEQLLGTFENLILAPAGNIKLIAALYSWGFILAVLEIAAYIVFGRFVLGASIMMPDIVTTLLMAVLSVLSLVPFGVAAAGVIIVFKKGNIVSLAAAYLFQILGGIYFPVSLLPDLLKKAAYILPITHILEAFRKLLINGGSFEMTQGNIIFLALFAAAALPVSILFFNYAVKTAKINGSLSHY